MKTGAVSSSSIAHLQQHLRVFNCTPLNCEHKHHRGCGSSQQQLDADDADWGDVGDRANDGL